jgi:hypothetical protein
VDLREYFSEKQVAEARRELADDHAFQREMHRHGMELDDLMTTSYPLKYLGIELGDDGRSRFDLATVLRIALRPRSHDGASKGLRVSTHRKAFIERMPDVDAMLNARKLYTYGRGAPIDDAPAFVKSAYAEAVKPALGRLEQYTGIPARVSLQVLKKGLAAYKKGHRPGMTAHGWARARLTSFTMKGCTHYFPDHLLVAECPARSRKFWSSLPCLCPKQGQCGHPGRRTSANAKHAAR